MARKSSQRYKKMMENTKGTNDFLIIAIILGMLCVWAVRDGWFPSRKTREEAHPVRVELAFAEAGRVAELVHEEGASYSASSPLVRLDVSSIQTEIDAVQQEVERIERELAAAEAAQADADEVTRLRRERMEAVQRTSGLRQSIATRTLRAPEKAGVVLEYMVQVGDLVEPDQAGVAVRPSTYFYTFNKSLALLSFVGAMVCLIVHLRIR